MHSSQPSIRVKNPSSNTNFYKITLHQWLLLLCCLVCSGTLLADTVTPASVTENLAATAPSEILYKVDGLEKPAVIRVDTWGVPHIEAGTHYDAFFVQGFNAARDRLWQIDTWRRRGLGQLAAVFGPSYVEQDKAARLFLYRGDMYREWLAYGSDAKRIATRFTDGINAFIRLIEQHPELLPPEFTLLDYAPSQWVPSDVVRIRSNGLWRNVTTELKRAKIACTQGLAIAAQWKVLEPTWETSIPAGLDPCAIPEDALDVYELAKAPVSFDALVNKLADRDLAGNLPPRPDEELNRSLGSNNWVVTGERTTTGRPILADDPHRGHAVPSLRYMAHLTAPGLNVIGAGEPALPGISIGHNNNIAFGLTIFPIDQEDLYVYRKRGKGYRYGGRNEAVTELTETVNVAGAKPETVTLRFTRHGPIVKETKKHLIAVRAAWLTEGMSPYFGSVEYMRAQNWDEFLAALNRWGAPAENQVYADVQGNIGYKPAGLFPRRPNWDGLLPVPGDGRYEWDGFFDMDVLPVEYNPERGFTGTANSMNLPDNYPIKEFPIGFEWSAPWRYQRLWEVLQNQPKHSMQDSLALQRDYTSILARNVIASLPPKLSARDASADQTSAHQLLTGWAATLEADSAPAALYAIWYYRHLAPGLAQAIAPTNPASISPLDSLTVLKQLSTDAGIDVALATLAPAWAETRQLLGDDPTQWRWGDLHQTAFKHPLFDLATGAQQQQMLMPAYPRGGSANTTNNTGFKGNNFDVATGASYRMVLDVGNWDAALMTNAPGQSGDWRSPHYQDLLKPWAEEQAFPLLFSREKILEHTQTVIRLEPN